MKADANSCYYTSKHMTIEAIQNNACVQKLVYRSRQTAFEMGVCLTEISPKPSMRSHLSGEDFQEHFSELHFGEL